MVRGFEFAQGLQDGLCASCVTGFVPAETYLKTVQPACSAFLEHAGSTRGITSRYQCRCRTTFGGNRRIEEHGWKIG